MEANGDRAARAEARLVEANVGLVRFLAGRMAISAAERDEYVSVGFLALLRAIRSFDPSRGHRLSGYAGAVIEHAISRYRTYEGRWLQSVDAAQSEDLMIGRDPGLYDDPGTSIEDEVIARDACHGLRRALEQLDQGDSDILARRFGIGGQVPYSEADLVSSLGISRKAVRCRTDKLLRQLAVALDRAR